MLPRDVSTHRNIPPEVRALFRAVPAQAEQHLVLVSDVALNCLSVPQKLR